MKIKEVFTEPEIIETGSSFLIKVKVADGYTWNELKELTWNEVKGMTFADLKGE